MGSSVKALLVIGFNHWKKQETDSRGQLKTGYEKASRADDLCSSCKSGKERGT